LDLIKQHKDRIIKSSDCLFADLMLLPFLEAWHQGRGGASRPSDPPALGLKQAHFPSVDNLLRRPSIMAWNWD